MTFTSSGCLLKLIRDQEFLRSASFFSLTSTKLLVGWGPRRWPLSRSPGLQPQFYFPDFFLRQKHSWWSHRHIAEIEISQLLEALEKEVAPSSTLYWKAPSLSLFTPIYQELQTLFAAGKLHKAVPYLFAKARAKMHVARRLTVLKNILKATEGGRLHAYGFWAPSQGMLGATPELLFKASTPGLRQIETMACAGTRAIEDLDETFRDDPKESHEHRLVIAGLQASLSELGGQVTVGSTAIWPLKRFAHLVTPIESQSGSDHPFDEIVRALHPSPALGAVPYYPYGRKWLQAYSNEQPRSRFGAPAGVFIPKRQLAHCVVAIRNVQWRDREIAVGAGCGVVPASSFENEWKELCLKIAATQELLGL